MKKFYVLVLSAFIFSACSSEQQEEEIAQPIGFNISSATFAGKSISPTAVLCQTSDLIAGQNEVAGTVEVYVDGTVLFVVYTTTDGWTMDETHMSLGNCTDDIPLTGSGNPKVGKFEYSAVHSNGTTVVTYTADSSSVPVQTCVAAHAVVTRSSGGNETAWGSGTEFPGRSWATYLEMDMSACSDYHNGTDGTGGTDGDPDDTAGPLR